mmetsp:Transcript_33980/g.102638  ORF Transcript_33980/g.102638 Transcript_33980/m.102638 type:complete len:307 (+) Transcript_33980:60-980(+)
MAAAVVLLSAFVHGAALATHETLAARTSAWGAASLGRPLRILRQVQPSYVHGATGGYLHVLNSSPGSPYLSLVAPIVAPTGEDKDGRFLINAKSKKLLKSQITPSTSYLLAASSVKHDGKPLLVMTNMERGTGLPALQIVDPLNTWSGSARTCTFSDNVQRRFTPVPGANQVLFTRDEQVHTIGGGTYVHTIGVVGLTSPHDGGHCDIIQEVEMPLPPGCPGREPGHLAYRVWAWRVHPVNASHAVLECRGAGIIRGLFLSAWRSGERGLPLPGPAPLHDVVSSPKEDGLLILSYPKKRLRFWPPI